MIRQAPSPLASYRMFEMFTKQLARRGVLKSVGYNLRASLTSNNGATTEFLYV